MRIGVDANGRSFRWKDAGACQTSYAICGILSDAEHPTMIWDNAMAGSAFSPCKALPLEKVWPALGYLGGVPSAVERANNLTPEPAHELLNAIAQLMPQANLDQHVVLAIPNLLHEDGQDALLSAFNAKRIFDSLLLWRPVAIALAWINANEQKSKQQLHGRKDLVIWDFESHCLEITNLGWKDSEGYACPVRHYPRLSDYANTPPFNSYDYAISIAAKLVAAESCHSLAAGPYAAAFQSNLETNLQAPVLYQDQRDPRRWRKASQRDNLIQSSFAAWKTRIANWACKHPNSHLLVHGWPARFCTFDEANIEVVSGDSVAVGCRIYAERLAKGLPTYFDSLPEYGIWAKYKQPDGRDDFGFRTVVQNEVVPGNVEWKAELHGNAETKAILESFSIPAHKNALSLFVRNRMQFDDDEAQKSDNPTLYGPKGIMVAKKLTLDLPANTREPIDLSMNISARPAAGHIRIEIRERKGSPSANAPSDPNVSWFGDSGRANFSWKTAEQEPEHKGYLEAQEVVGRIMDPVQGPVARTFGLADYKQLAWLAVKKLNGKLESTHNEMQLLQVLINDYGNPNPFNLKNDSDEKLINHLLEPWGYKAIPPQPTRGLFGSRITDDSEILGIAEEIGLIITSNPNIDDKNKWKYLNYMFVYAPHVFCHTLNKLFTELPQCANVYTWNQIIAAGRVIENTHDFEQFVRWSILAKFVVKDSTYTQWYWWSFFRCLCYHDQTAQIPSCLVYQYLQALLDYEQSHNLVPANRFDQRRKFAIHVVLFALRKRDPRFADDPDFLNPKTGLGKKLGDLIRHGSMKGEKYPPSMLAGMKDMIEPGDDLSKFVWRFLNYEDTLKDREIGAGLATS